MIELAPGVTVTEGELAFKATRSGGPGGQNVNKVATRVELVWCVGDSPSLDDRMRGRLLSALSGRLDGSGCLRVVSAEERSQSANRERCLEKLRGIVRAALRPRPRRIPTRPSRAARERRLRQKRQQAEKKRRRRAPDDP